MDPLTALTIATSTAQFIQFGASLISGTIEIYQSATGAKETHLEVEALVERTKDLVGCLDTSSADNSPRLGRFSPYDRQLRVIVAGCRDAASQLASILDELKAKGRHRLTESLLVTVKSMRKEKKVQQLHKKLLGLQSELSCCLISIVQ